MDNSSYSNPNSCVSTSHASKEKKKKGGNGNGGMKLSTDPQSVAARQRRHRISDRFKILQSLVPGGSKLDTVSMLEEAIQYVKFLKAQIWLHQAMIGLADVDAANDPTSTFPANQCSAVPVHHDPHVDLCNNNNNNNNHSDDQAGEAEMGFGWQVSWVSGDGNNGLF